MSGTRVDDAGPGVVYTGSWTVSTSGGAYRGTSHLSRTPSDRLTLSFQGIGVLVDTGPQGVGWRPRSSYSIDGGSPTVYGNDSYSSSEAYRSPTLNNGQHTLTVINIDPSASASLFVDFFVVFTSDDAVVSIPPSSASSSSSSSSSASASSSSSPSSNALTSSAVTSTATTAVTSVAVGTATGSPALSGPHIDSPSGPSSSSAGNASNPIPLIVGPIIAAIVICIIIYLWLRRRAKKTQDPQITPAAFSQPIRYLPAVWENGQKPSSVLRDANEPPPYAQNPGPSLLTPTSIREPAKFGTR